MQRGLPLDQAVAAHEGGLPVLYSRIIRAGVESGQLSATLMNLSQHLRLLAQSRRVVFDSLSYPFIVLFTAVTIFSCIVRWVIPQFESIFMDFDTRLPALTMMLFRFANAYPAILAVGLIVCVVLVVGWGAMRLGPSGRRVRERLILMVPVVGQLIRASLLARFLQSIALSVNSGIPLPEAIRLAAGATGSPALSGDANRIAERIEEGDPVTKACQSTALVPALFGYVTDISSDRNNLSDAMIQLAGAYKIRAAHQVGLLREWLVPLAFLGLAFSVGACVLALFLPLVSLLESISI